jgi:thymidylate kinase
MQSSTSRPVHPRYLVLEGPKGVGKTTLIERLQRHFAATGERVAWIAPTRAPLQPHPLEQALAAQLEQSTDDALRERFFALRSELATAATDWSAPLILGDRSLLTSYVTRLRNFASPAAAIAHVDAMEPSIPLPATVFYLDAPIETLLARVAHRGARPNCVDEQAERILRAREDYLLLRRSGTALGLPPMTWWTVDAGGTADDTFDRVVTLLQQARPNRLHPSLSSVA